MSNENSYAWAQSCQYGSKSTCAEKPLLMQTAYDTSLSTPLATFSDNEFSGYTGSGEVFLDQVCFNSKCTYQKIYAVTSIINDENISGYDAAYGILGMGPTSSLWMSFIDDETN